MWQRIQVRPLSHQPTVGKEGIHAVLHWETCIWQHALCLVITETFHRPRTLKPCLPMKFPLVTESNTLELTMMLAGFTNAVHFSVHVRYDPGLTFQYTAYQNMGPSLLFVIGEKSHWDCNLFVKGANDQAAATIRWLSHPGTHHQFTFV